MKVFESLKTTVLVLCCTVTVLPGLAQADAPTPELVRARDLQHLKRDELALRQRGLDCAWLRTDIARLEENPLQEPSSELTSLWKNIRRGYEALELRDLLESKIAASRLDITGSPSSLPASFAKLNKLAKVYMLAVRDGDHIQAGSLQIQANEQLAQIDGDSAGKLTEGVSLRSYGRFGWFTGANSGWIIGDGALANQITENQLVREYIRDVATYKRIWRLQFGVSGESAGNSPMESAIDWSKIAPVQTEEIFHAPGAKFSSKTSSDVVVEKINWMSKTFLHKKGYRVTISLPHPATRIETDRPVFFLNNLTASQYDHMAWVAQDGTIITRPVSSGYNIRDDGPWGRNWVLFWSTKNDLKDAMGRTGSIPLQVILTRPVQQIHVSAARGLELVFDSKSGAGTLWLNTPYGTDLTHDFAPEGKLLADLQERLDRWSRSALAYPIGGREFYKVEKQTVRVVTAYQFDYSKDSWRTSPLELAPIPPLLSFAFSSGYDGTAPEGCLNLNYPTLYGPLEAGNGKTVSYTLAVPDHDSIALLRNAGAPKDLVQFLNGNMQREIRRFDGAGQSSDGGFNAPIRVHQISIPLVGYQYWDDETRSLYPREKAWQGVEEFLERRRLLQWHVKVEPYSGRKFFSSYELGRKQMNAEGNGSDVGWGIGLSLQGIDSIVRHFGLWDRLREVWDDKTELQPYEAAQSDDRLTIRNIMSIFEVINDWAWMDAGSNPFGGNGPVVDCVQATYMGYAAYVRMADQLKAIKDAERGRYLLARSVISLAYRQHFNSYAQAHGFAEKDSHIAGFREDSKVGVVDHFANPMRVDTADPAFAYNAYVGTELCNLSTAAGEDMSSIYFPIFKYAYNALYQWEVNVGDEIYPDRYRHDGPKFRHGLPVGIYYRLLIGYPATPFIDVLRRDYPNLEIENRWNCRWNTETVTALLSSGVPFVMADWGRASIPDASYDVKRQTAIIRLPDGLLTGELRGFARRAVASVSINGQSRSRNSGSGNGWSYDPSSYRFTTGCLPTGPVEIEIAFAGQSDECFGFIPLPTDAARQP